MQSQKQKYLKQTAPCTLSFCGIIIDGMDSFFLETHGGNDEWVNKIRENKWSHARNETKQTKN